MAITKRTEEDKIEVVGEFKHIQVRTATVIEEDGVELSRHGMDYKLWQDNIEYFLKNTHGAGVTIMSAFNILSITSIKEMLEWVLILKQDYNYTGWDKWLIEKGFTRPAINENAKPMNERQNEKYNKRNRVIVDIPYVRHPEFLDAGRLPISSSLVSTLTVMSDHPNQCQDMPQRHSLLLTYI